MTPARRHLALVLAVLALVLPGMPALSAVGDSYVRPHFGDGRLPAGCVVDLDPANPDNDCYHLKVGLNALDDPKVDVAVLVPVSPAVERDLRLMKQVVHMWEGGIDKLAGEMGLDWLRDGVDFRVTGEAVPVDEQGGARGVIHLVDPEVVVIATNPVGGIGIGIDPSDFASQLAITDGEGLPCTTIPEPMNLEVWEARPGYDGHHGDQGGIYVADCKDGVGGNVCFAVNGAIDPVPGTTDFFGLFDLVAHEFGHCLTLGHVGDGADGPWGPTAFNDIMAYSTDPPGLSKCVSTLDVEGFALQMSRYLDVNGDDRVTDEDHLHPNDVEGDGTSSFHVQHPDDHHYASATGRPQDCPQPDSGLVPTRTTDWSPAAVRTTTPRLRADRLQVRDGRLTVTGAVARVPREKQPTAHRAAADDASGDATTPITDIERVSVSVDRRDVEAVLHVGQVNPLTDGASLTAYSVVVSGRRFDSFIANGTTDSRPTTVDNGAGTVMPPGTSTWDAATGTVRFRIPRRYLADERITAPYEVSGQTGVHARTNDWLVTDDVAPDRRGLRVAAPRMAAASLDAPLSERRTRSKRELEHPEGNTFVPTDSTLGVGLLPTGGRHVLPLPVRRQSAVRVTLTWDDPASFLGLKVSGGSEGVEESGDQKITVVVPWARRDLQVTVDPEQVSGPVTYTVTARLTSLTRADDRDGDRVPDAADDCDTVRGPAVGAGCPDTDRDLTFDRHDACPRAAGTGPRGCPTRGDERVVVRVDGKQVAAQPVLTDHGRYPYRLRAAVGRGRHLVRVVWYDGSKVVRSLSKQL